MTSPLAREAAGLDRCVHCGFCLQSCPTYLTLGDENDSPRGRLVLMRSLLEGVLDPSDTDLGTHLDRCLGCRACETACPSGVPYGELLEATRATIRRHRPRSWLTTLLLFVFGSPAARRAVMAAGRLMRAILPASLEVPGRAGLALRMLRATKPVAMTKERPRAGSTPDGTRERVGVLVGCVMEELFAPTNRATERVLAINGYPLIEVADQGCCGALHVHAGHDDEARSLARANIAAFEAAGVDTVCVNASGCGAAMREYGHLLRHDPAWAERAAAFSRRVRDVSELLAAAGPLPAGPMPLRVTYDAPCHLVHGQRVARAPLQVLEAIEGLDHRPLADRDVCCGSAGIYNLAQPDIANEVLRAKLARIEESGADVVVTGNPGCLMQLGAGLSASGSRIRVVHLVDLLDAAYAEREARGR